MLFVYLLIKCFHRFFICVFPCPFYICKCYFLCIMFFIFCNFIFANLQFFVAFDWIFLYVLYLQNSFLSLQILFCLLGGCLIFTDYTSTHRLSVRSHNLRQIYLRKNQITTQKSKWCIYYKVNWHEILMKLRKHCNCT